MTLTHPVVFWVIGTASDVGKTTVARALLRHLNANAIPALGFKPLSGGLLHKHVDFAVEHYPLLPGRVFGRDGLLLARASPLTCDDDVDLVTPWQALYHRSVDDILLVRAGSQSLNNVRYFTCTDALQLWARADLARLARLLHLPLDSAQLFDSQQRRGQLAPEIPEQAYKALLRRQPAAVVVEGAAHYLPTWAGAPAINHVVVVAPEHIMLVPHVNEQVPHDDTRLGTTPQLLKAFTTRELPAHRVLHGVVESAIRDAASEMTIGGLLKKAGL